MSEWREERRAAIRFWERGRLVYNVVLAIPAIGAYSLGADMSAAIGDLPAFGTTKVARLFVEAALGANVLFTLVYALEFLLGDLTSRPTRRRIRLSVLVFGILFGAVLAFHGGVAISNLQYPDR
jgi:hypothetical protein